MHQRMVFPEEQNFRQGRFLEILISPIDDLNLRRVGVPKDTSGHVGDNESC